MKNITTIYGPNIFRAVIHIYGTKSQIYLDMMAGKKISDLIRESIRKKGPAYRIREKKDLLKACKQAEEYLDVSKGEQYEL